jgi:BirA family biotin operon repressor/biotin-[acetyl-CoA-carboxylase] ligase
MIEKRLKELNPSLLKERLKTKFLGREILYFPSISSTNSYALMLAANDIPEGTVVIAEEQTKGRGRGERKWHSPPLLGLYLSIILKRKATKEMAGIYSILSGIAVAEAIGEFITIMPDLRWPNDILLGGKKIAGVLIEEAKEKGLVVGIGVNVNGGKDDFPPWLRDEATSFFLESGWVIERNELFLSLMERFEYWYEIFCSYGSQKVLERFEEISSYSRGRKVKLLLKDNPVKGVTAGLFPGGELKVRLSQGEELKVSASELVRLE